MFSAEPSYILVVPLYSLYPATPTLSVDASQASVTLLLPADVTLKLAGVDGGVASAEGGGSGGGGALTVMVAVAVAEPVVLRQLRL